VEAATMASVAKLREVIKDNKAGQYWDDYGPFKIGGASVCEIWTIGEPRRSVKTGRRQGDEDTDGPVNDPEIRFWLEGGEEKYFECFGDLAVHLDEKFAAAARAGAEVELTKEQQTEELKRKRIQLYVASIVFIAVVGCLIVAFYREPSYLVAFLLGGVIASACVLFFGVWQPITLPDWTQKS
jgi:hypothetical protein